ncbi:AAA family ATPase [Candidatus Dependentiae bacterium]|nr:AAA family ATPase [Candidatus Dependentiae bacterium]
MLCLTDPHAHLFTNKQIWQHATYRAIQGSFPVISITFKDIKHTTRQETYNALVVVLAEEIKRHKAALHGVMDEYDQESIDNLIRKTANSVDYAGSLKLLSQLLAKAYNCNTIVLLDEYDTPIHAGFVHGFYDEVVSFIRNLMGAVFKGNSYLERGVITGIMRTAKEGIFSGLNNLMVCDILDEKFSDKFGFTESEIDQLLNDYELTGHREVIKQWYNGYQFGNTCSVYNPWSVLNCADNKGSTKTYWVNTSDNAVIKQLVANAGAKVKQELEVLLQKQASEHEYDLNRSVIFSQVTRNATEALWSFLLFTGYITIDRAIEKTVAIFQDFEMKKTFYALRIPNLEIRELYSQLLKEFMTQVISSRVELLLESFITGRQDTVAKYLQEFIINSMSFHDLPDEEAERSYHVFILGLLVLLEARYEVRSNRESGLGRYDIMLIPFNPQKDAGVVIEFKKKQDKKETLQEAAQKALDQIIEKKYATQLQAKGCTTIYHYGIGFDGKELVLQMV